MSGYRVNSIKISMIMRRERGCGSIMGYLDRANDVQLIKDIQEIQKGRDNDLKKAMGQDSQEARNAFDGACKSLGLQPCSGEQGNI